MVKLTILFRQPSDEMTFEGQYNYNLSLMEQLPGLKRRQACMVIGSPAGKSPYYRILELYFDDNAALDQALRSPEGQTAGRDLMKFAAKEAELIFSEVFEE
jgi:uncharacterized protein (TIGR02118 family)